jgi:opacity protein-like surface antigen
MRWSAIFLVAFGLAHAASAAELDSDYLRGAMVPSYPATGVAPPSLPDDAAPIYTLADIEPPPVGPLSPWNWTGFYIGGTVSLGSGTFDPTTATTLTGAYFPNSAVVAAVNSAGAQKIKPVNAAPGVTAGYNVQSGNIVFGVEADIQAVRLSGGVAPAAVGYPGFAPVAFAIASAASANWLFTARPRIGWTYDNWLVYGTAGAAMTNLNAQFTFADEFGASESGIFSSTRFGYAVGGGIEAALWDRWSAKAEYLYVHFNPVSLTSANLILYPGFPIPGQPFTHSADLSANIVRLGLNYRFGEQTAGQAVAGMPVKAPAMVPAWNWTGLYIGGQTGAASSSATFSDPFGASVFGDTVRSPGFLLGGQVGFNWQPPGSRWVLGVEADANWMDADGTVTCFAASAMAVNSTCRVRPQATATVTGRVGYAIDPAGRTLLYGKGGVAWANSKVDMALGNDLAGFIGPGIASNETSFAAWGWTVGFGAEYALTPAWSLKFEYDYLAFRSQDVANLGSSTFDPLTGAMLSTAPSGTSGVAQNIQAMKMGVNYRWGGTGSVAYAESAPTQAWLPGWQIEIGGRYFGGWGQFHKDIGTTTNSGLPSISSVSRLTYNDMQTNAGELFGRIYTPWSNMFIKGYVGGSSIKNGHMNDEDFGIPLVGTYAAYSNTLSSAEGSVTYGAVDAGFDFLRAPGYKIAGFVGLFYFKPRMSAFGCTPLANVNCIPSIPAADSPVISEFDQWRALRIGVSGEVMLSDRLKLSGEVAYLPYATFDGLDQHFFGNTPFLASDNPESGKARGVQLEVLVSYYLTPQLSVGFGGRYWGMSTTSAQVTRDIDNGGPIPSTPPQFFKGVVEQGGAFVQAAWCFGPEWF